jgi:cytochrome c oxidase subunit 2
MPIVVEVKSEADYAAWVDQQASLKADAAAAETASLSATASMEELMELGLTTYTAHCAACHQPNGLGLPPVFPALKGSPLATTGSIDGHIDIVVNGRAGSAMQSYSKQLSLKEIAAVVTYERNAWGNDTGEMVQAADVKAFSEPAGSASETEVKTEVNAVVEEVKAVVEDAVPVEDLTKVYSLDELMTMGEEVYLTSCAACHQATGLGLPPTFPALKGSEMATTDIPAHIDIVVNGSKTNPSMASFSAQLTKTQIAAVVTYERNAWGNDTGDLVQPADINAASAK